MEVHAGQGCSWVAFENFLCIQNNTVVRKKKEKPQTRNINARTQLRARSCWRQGDWAFGEDEVKERLGGEVKVTCM